MNAEEQKAFETKLHATLTKNGYDESKPFCHPPIFLFEAFCYEVMPAFWKAFDARLASRKQSGVAGRVDYVEYLPHAVRLCVIVEGIPIKGSRNHTEDTGHPPVALVCEPCTTPLAHL